MDQANALVNLDTAGQAENVSVERDLFALTDEQILELEPEAQTETADEARKSEVARGQRPGATQSDGQSIASAPAAAVGAADARGTVAEPPRWLAEMMADPQNGGEARDFWSGVNQAREEAAAYREVFAGPAEARAAAERARVLDEIDGAYFAGDAGARSKLAATMLREDPAAFRDMVFEGLRALEEMEKGGGRGAGESRMARVFGGTAATSGQGASESAAANGQVAPAASVNSDRVAVNSQTTGQAAQMAAYAAFEKSANEDLERSVTTAIGRTLEQALPGNGRGDNAALRSRLVGAIRQDVEKALQGDRRLGEQVAQLLSGKRLNDETRAQVVRLIGERAEQLVPGAAKRILSDWTQTTLAAHREKTGRGAVAVSRPEVATAAAGGGVAGRGDGQDKPGRGQATTAPGRAVDYRKVSDEQILAM